MVGDYFRSNLWWLLVAGQLVWSCAYENEEELFGANPCDPDIVTYQLVIEPIFSQNCSIPGCHDGSNNSIPDWQVFSNVEAYAQEIKQRTGDRTMPPSSSDKLLSAKQIADIACWVDNGAQNN